MGKKLVLIGGGGHCKSVIDTILRMKTYDNIVITDPQIKPGSKLAGCEVMGDDSVLQELYYNGFSEAFVTVGAIKNTSLRRKLFENAMAIGFEFPNIIDPSAAVSSLLKMGRGVFIGKQAVVNAQADIGDGVIINTASVVEHECIIGAFTHIAVGAVVCGQTRIGENVFIGAGSTVIQGIHIGANTIVGAGSTVLRDVRENELVYGVVKKRNIDKCVRKYK